MDVTALAEILGTVAAGSAMCAAAVVGAIAAIKRVKAAPIVPPPRPNADGIDPLGDTGSWIAPDYQARMLRRMAEQLDALADRENGHGVVRREWAERLERKQEQMDRKLDRVSEQVAAMRANCAARTKC